MKKILLLSFLLLVLSGINAQTNVQSPCTDSTYLALKGKSINTMSDREFAYFSQKDKECSEYTRVKEAEERSKAQIKQQEQETEKMMQDIKRKSSRAYFRSIIWLGLTLGAIFLLL